MITDDKMISIIKENDKSYLLSLLEESGKVKTLSAFAPVLDKRAYFTINESGELKRKNNNLIIPFFAYCNDNELLAENIFEKYCTAGVLPVPPTVIFPMHIISTPGTRFTLKIPLS